MVDSNNSDEIQISSLVEKWAKAVREKDMNGALAHHTDDILMFDVPPPLQSKGIAAYKETWELFFSSSSGGDGAFDVTELKITSGDTVAFCHALINVSGNKARLTMGVRKIRGQWLITHEHHSYPIESS
ncbi:MAG: nuclear transport factor 2 family protein [Chloroflexota bacterium]|nr:nuclear transport factor 2 family protein [Chloroflexota bacterium]